MYYRKQSQVVFKTTSCKANGSAENEKSQYGSCILGKKYQSSSMI